MGKILRWPFCPIPLGVLTLMFCATRNTKNTSGFDSKSNFLRIVLSSHCLWDKRRLAPAMHPELLYTYRDVRFDNTIALIRLTNCLPLTMTVIIGQVTKIFRSQCVG